MPSDQPFTAASPGFGEALRNRDEPDPLKGALSSLASCIAGHPADFGKYHRDSWLYGIVLGWDCEDRWKDPGHECDDICGGDAAMREQAARHDWDDAEVARLRRYRLAYATAEGRTPGA